MKNNLSASLKLAQRGDLVMFEHGAVWLLLSVTRVHARQPGADCVAKLITGLDDQPRRLTAYLVDIERIFGMKPHTMVCPLT